MSKHYFPATDGGGMTYEEIARELGCTRQRVQQIERNALKKLRRGPVSVTVRDLEEMGRDLARARARRVWMAGASGDESEAA